MDMALKVAAGLPAMAFVLLGLSWWIVPSFASAQLGMTLQDGIGLSSQIGDVASFFLTGEMVGLARETLADDEALAEERTSIGEQAGAVIITLGQSVAGLSE